MALAPRFVRNPLPLWRRGWIAGKPGMNEVPSFGSNFALTLFTDDVTEAAAADAAGIDRIGVDLESIGKRERQAHLGSFRVSAHEIGKQREVAEVLTHSDLFARTNPVHPGSATEIDFLLGCGTRVLMLPAFTTAAEVARFVDLVGGRARVCLLLETVDAADRIREIVSVRGVDEIHVGLNDLGISTGAGIGLRRFSLLSSGLLEELSRNVRAAGIRFAVGGLGRALDQTLPVPSDLVYAQYPRLGACGAIVARSFLGVAGPPADLPRQVCLCRQRLDYWAAVGDDALGCAKLRLTRHLETLQ